MSDGARSEGQHSAFVWKTDKRGGDTSPHFKTLQREFWLVFWNSWYEESDYRLLLYNKDPPPSPFDVSVFLIVGEESTCAPCTTTVREKYFTIVWKTKKSDLSKIDPGFERKTFRFLIVMHDPVAPGKEHTVDKSVQTSNASNSGSSNSCLEYLSADYSKLVDEVADPGPTTVLLKCGDSTFQAHKPVLSARSSVFDAMMKSDMVEGRTNCVELRDMDEGVFRNFVRYLYSGTLTELSWDVAKKLYAAGDQYAVEGLKKRCALFLSENLSAENACEGLVLADSHSDLDFKESVISFVLAHKIPLLADQWSNFAREHPVLSNEVLYRSYRLQMQA